MTRPADSDPAGPAPIRVLIADDHTLILEMFKIFLADLPDIEATTAQTLDEALACIAGAGPFDIVLLDLNMPGMNGISGLCKGLEANGGKPVAILTGAPSPRMVEEIMANGGAGIVLKTTSLRSLANAIRFMAAGEQYIPMELVRDKTGRRDDMPLSDKEMQVLGYLAEGLPNREIGNALNLAEPTIKMHVKSICKKLGVSNRTQAVIATRDLGLI